MSDKVYQLVTDRIVAQMEQGIVPWKKPWCGGAAGPQNLVSRRPYHGMNVIMTVSMGYGSPYWCTYKQAQSLGGSVRKGERGTPIVFWKFLETEKKTDDGKVKKATIPFLRYFACFNAEQIDGIHCPDSPSVSPVEPPDLCREYLRNGPSVAHTGFDVACYSPSEDRVTLPKPAQFASEEAYHATLYHELGHSTGHKSRLDRPFGARFGNDKYSREELVAEMTAAFLCAQSGISPVTEENTVAYLQSWTAALKADSRAVVVAAGAAQKAADLIATASAVAVAA